MNRMVGPLGDFSADIHPPSTFHFPTETQYTQALSSAVKYTTDWGLAEVKAAFSLPAQSSITSIKTLVENTAGTSLSGLISGQMPAGAPALVTGMMTNALDGAIDLVVSGLSAAVGNTLVSIVDAVPVLGQMVGAFVGIIQQIADASNGVQISPQDEETAENVAYNRWASGLKPICQENIDRCPDVRATYYNKKTGNVEKTVADTFRPFAYAMHAGAYARNGAIAIPWCGPMPFVALCGGETEGVLWKNRAEYNTVLGQLRQKYNDQRLGIPPEAQRRMWKYIKGICASVNNPAVAETQRPTGDSGRSMMPLLVDLVWSFCNDNARRSSSLKTSLPGYWTVPFLTDLVNYHAPSYTAGGSSGGQVSVVRSGNCWDLGFQIVGDFDRNWGWVKTFSDYDIKIDYNFGRSAVVLNPNVRHVLDNTQKKGAVVVTSAEGVVDFLRSLPTLSFWQAGAVTAGALAAGYLGYEGYRALAKGKRR